jgi:hypothetical protein
MDVSRPEKVIPVRIMCTAKQIQQIISLTLEHYRQKAVLAYKLSNEVFFVWAKGFEP